MSEHPCGETHQAIAWGTTRGAPFGEERQPERVIHPRFRLPDWVLEQLRANSSAEEILRMLTGRVLNRASNLHEAQRILNDLGQRPTGGAAVKQFVTQDIITRLARR
jgi:hypothetical protein